MDNSRLRKLSPELLNQIYELVLFEPGGFLLLPSSIYYNNNNKTGLTSAAKFKPRARFATALTRTCREIRNNTLVMFYAINTFRLGRPRGLGHRVEDWDSECKSLFMMMLKACRTWLKRKLPKEAANAITKLSIQLPMGGAWEPTNRSVLWWDVAENLGNKYLYGVMKPCSIFIDFRMVFAHRKGHICHDDVLDASRTIVYQLPVNDKAATRAEVDRIVAHHSENIDTNAKQYPCCCLGVQRTKLLDGLELSRLAVMRAIGE